MEKARRNKLKGIFRFFAVRYAVATHYAAHGYGVPRHVAPHNLDISN